MKDLIMHRALSQVFKSELQAFDDIKSEAAKIFQEVELLAQASREHAAAAVKEEKTGGRHAVLACRYDEYPDLRNAYITLYIVDMKPASIETLADRVLPRSKAILHKPQLSAFFFRDKDTGIARVETRCFDRPKKGMRSESVTVLDVRNLSDFSVEDMGLHAARWLARNMDLEGYKGLLRHSAPKPGL